MLPSRRVASRRAPYGSGIGELGDVFEVLHRTPTTFTSLRGTLREWTDDARRVAAMQRHERESVGGDARVSAQIVRVGVVGITTETAHVEPTERETRVWYSPPDRWRFEGDGSFTLYDGEISWRRFGDHVVRSDSEQPDPGPLGWLTMPSVFLGVLDVTDLGPTSVAGRPTRRLQLGPRQGMTHLAHMGLGFLHFRLGSSDLLVDVDLMTGVLLRSEALLDGAPLSITEFTDVAFDDPLADDLFTYPTPDGPEVRTQHQLIVETMAGNGADTSDVDMDDPESVERFMNAFHGIVAGQGLDHLEAAHMPIGPPPVDEDDARSAITSAFEGTTAVSSDGDHLINVQGGRGLGECVRQAQQRFAGTEARFQGDRVLFLSDREAVVWFSVALEGNPTVRNEEGRALLIDGRWLVSRATLCRLLARAGVHCPPPT